MRLSIALFLMLLTAACDRQKEQGSQPGAPETGRASATPEKGLDRARGGRAAPDAEFKDPAGEPVSLADFKGEPLLLNLWATWCAPCVAEMPTLDALAARQDKLQVLAVSQDVEGQEAKVAAFFEERKLGALEAYQDPQLSLMQELEVGTLPTTILYDSEGREVWRMVGALDWNGAEAAKLIAEAR